MDTNNDQDLENEFQTFRDSIGTAEKSGKRKWVYPKKPSGKHYKWRSIVSYLLLTLLIVIPFVKIGGNPLFKFDIIKREFYIFSYPFFTSDFKIFAIGMVSSIVFIILFTVIYGRIFCGWLCPQTIFLEMVFRKIEYAIEGDRNKQIKLDKQDWDAEKIRKKVLKWVVFVLISIIITNIMFAWVIGVDELQKLVMEGPIKNMSTFIGMAVFTALFFFVFTWFREQACVIVCPYGRLQGVLIDRKTIIVAYDYKRGERSNGRARFRKGVNRADEGIGDCIDCNQCVAVCPTGIDIRNGTQLECVNCTACMDACDEVMTKIKLPTGLIRYASEENIAENKPFKFNARHMAYTFVLLILMGVGSSFLFLRSDVNSKFLRDPGTDYKIVNKNIVTNVFEYDLQNKTKETQQMHFKLANHKGGTIKIIGGGDRLFVQAGEQLQGKVLISIPKEELSSYKERITINVLDQNNKVVDTYTTSFAAPFQ